MANGVPYANQKQDVTNYSANYDAIAVILPRFVVWAQTAFLNGAHHQ